jgi:hypothetical protein
MTAEEIYESLTPEQQRDVERGLASTVIPSLSLEQRRVLIRYAFQKMREDLASDDPQRQREAYEFLLPVARVYDHATVEAFLQDDPAVKSFLEIVN